MVSVEGPGGSGLFGLETPVEEAGLVVVPVPFEATVSYGHGTARGPAAILAASPQIDLFDLETGRPYEVGLAMLPEDPEVLRWNDEACALAREVIAAGGAEQDPTLAPKAAQVDAYAERVNAWLGERVEALLAEGRRVAVVGGDHSVPFAAIAAQARRRPGLGILHVDAHADQRKAYEGFRWSHASIMHNVREQCPGVAKLVGVGYRDLSESEHAVLESDPRCVAYYDPIVRQRLHAGASWGELAAEIVGHLPKEVYVSFDIDGLDPALCPSTGTPVPGGLSFPEAMTLLRAVVESGRRIVGFDLCEVAPDPRGESEWDGNVGARVLYKLIGWMLRSEQPR